MPRSPKAAAPALPGYAISELNSFQCKFAITPHDAPSHRFCGDPTTDVKVPWCVHHQTIVFDRRTKEQMARDHAMAAKAREGRSINVMTGVKPILGLAKDRNDE